MRILYAIQGTGNGHITRAIELIPYLAKAGELDILVSGISSDLPLPFQVKYRFKGLSFVFGKKGGVDVWRTYWKMKVGRLLKEINALPIQDYDLVISDFEPVSAWACKLAGKHCIGLSNQVATLHPQNPLPSHSDPLGSLILNRYAPCSIAYGLHFKALDQHIFTPIIRKEVREIQPQSLGYYTVYLPSYSDKKILKNLHKFEAIKWQVFSKNARKAYKDKNVNVFPIDSHLFLQSMAGAEGVLCNAGFGTTTEALFLKKKLLVVPMKNQYEQHCNAAVLASMGVPVMKKLKKKYRIHIQNWLASNEVVAVDYPDNAAIIADTLVQNHEAAQAPLKGWKGSFKKMFKHL